MNTIYLEVLDSLGYFHGDREQLVEATDKRGSYGLKDQLVAQRVHPLPKIVQTLLHEQLTTRTNRQRPHNVTRGTDSGAKQILGLKALDDLGCIEDSSHSLNKKQKATDLCCIAAFYSCCYARQHTEIWDQASGWGLVLYLQKSTRLMKAVKSLGLLGRRWAVGSEDGRTILLLTWSS